MTEITSVVQEIMQKMLKKLEYMRESEQTRSKNEILPEFSKLNLSSEPEFVNCELLELGTVLHYTEGFLVIAPSPRAPLLEFDTKVCTEDFRVVGKIDDIIGSVDSPVYSVAAYKYLLSGTEVFYPNGASILSSISNKRGTDASNFNDEETSEESSDDFSEKKKNQKTRKRKKNFGIFERPPPFE